MKRYNITTKRVYTKDGVEKSQWNTVGSLIKFEAKDDKAESFILELNMFPNEKYFVFEQKSKDDNRTKKEVVEEINSEEIPF